MRHSVSCEVRRLTEQWRMRFLDFRVLSQVEGWSHSLLSLWYSYGWQGAAAWLGRDRIALLPARGGKGQLYHRSFTKAVALASGSSVVSTDLKPTGKTPSSQSQTRGSGTYSPSGTSSPFTSSLTKLTLGSSSVLLCLVVLKDKEQNQTRPVLGCSLQFRGW